MVNTNKNNWNDLTKVSQTQDESPINNIRNLCNIDSDCDKNNLCAFDEEKLTNYCIENNINNMYYGCLANNAPHPFESIETKSNNIDFDYNNCIDFSRRQVNKDGLEYNYMIYKPKKKVFVDTTTINIYLKCEEEILAVIPYIDYFHIKCDENQEYCTLESKESLLNFIIQNSKNCNKKLYLDITYECENERLKKNTKIFIDINNFNTIEINLSCPIDLNNQDLKSKCEALYINNSDSKKDYNELIDMKKTLMECKNPVFKIPRLIRNIDNYKKAKYKNSNNEIKEYESKINEKIEDLRKLEAEKYIKLKENQTGQKISLEEAYEIINQKNLNKLIVEKEEKWKIFENFDAAQNIFPSNETNKILTYFGKVYTLNDAIKAASENNQSFFVWYHNSYELDNFASKLYFVDMYYTDTGLLKKTNWVSSENVTTCVSKNSLEYVVEQNEDIEFDEDLHKLKEIFDTSSGNNEYLQTKIDELLSKNLLENKNINNSVIKDLDNKITTYGQIISMNNYETNINNKILIALTIISALMIIIFVVVMVYFNNLTGGKIKLFGM